MSKFYGLQCSALSIVIFACGGVAGSGEDLTDSAIEDGSFSREAGSFDDGSVTVDGSADASQSDAGFADGGSTDGATDGMISDDGGMISDAAMDAGPMCEAPNVVCDADCVDTNRDLRHCGKCGNLCPGTQGCFQGKCETPKKMPNGIFEHQAIVGKDGLLYVFGGFEYGTRLQSTSAMWVYDPERNTWTAGATYALYAKAASTTAADGNFYATGGQVVAGTVIQTTSWVFKYDLQAKTWSKNGNMIKQRRRHALTTGLDGRLYVFGGSDFQGEPRDTAEVYDPNAETWTYIQKLPEPLAGCRAVTATTGKIFIFCSRAYPLVYDPKQDTYRKITDSGRPFPEGEFDLDAAGDTVYELRWREDQVDRYTLPSLQPTSVQLPPVDFGRNPTMAVTEDGRVFLTGGADRLPDDEYNDRLMIYDPVSNRWAY